MEETKINKFDRKRVEEVLKTENQFITNLFSVLALPQNHQNDEESDIETSPKNLPQPVKKTSRATSLVELQNRIDKLKNKDNTYKAKLQKKNLKNKLKKKMKAEKRGPKIKSTRPNIDPKEKDNKTDLSTDKVQPVYNNNDKIVFSKIDFAGLGNEKHRKTESNPKKVLEQVQEINNKIDKLKSSGEITKAIEIKEKNAWKNALAKTQGIKVKDDPILLKKSIQKQEQKKRSSKKKWESRIESVNKAKEERQKKRGENIDKRKKEKKLHKLKKSVKRGKVIPGL